MPNLTATQQTALQELMRLCAVASRELDEVYDTGRMSDAKYAVYQLKTAAGAVDLPAETQAELQELAQATWHGTSGAGGGVYDRATKGLVGLGNLERFINSLLETAGD